MAILLNPITNDLSIGLVSPQVTADLVRVVQNPPSAHHAKYQKHNVF